ncbi:response regulator [Cohnella sp. WQ 127256]|uniref:response regulator n=1 Tax=Cohnella sp. WQ 127256 TaxID=2938790 RepID=UPI0021197BE0|nr:response regulator [Cohnella sp. WQ 127256]
MNRLLIVDNEDYVVEGLLEVFRQLPHFDLEVIGAYSAREALEWMQRTKIDIVVSDIRMPGMDGITLQREIVRYWPKCKVIFLSGFNDFDYAQNAIRGGALDYVLKTDGDERLIEAVEKAVAKLKDEIEIEQLIAKSKQQMRMASEALQQDFMRQLLHGERIGDSELTRQFANLHIPLQPTMTVLPIIGRVDEWMGDLSHYDRYLLLYSIRNIAGEYLDATVTLLSIPMDPFNIVWLIQPKGIHPDSPQRVREDTWNMMVRFVQGTFELIQGACKDLIKLELSVIIADTPVQWDGLGRKFASLKGNMLWGLGSGREMLMVDQHSPGEASAEGAFTRDAATLIGSLASMLDNNRREPFFALLDELLDQQDTDHLEKHYYMAASVILSFHTKEQRLAGTEERWDVSRLIRLDPQEEPQEAVEYLRRCGASIFDCRERLRGESENELMTNVKAFIADHLSDELSLTAIAENTGHNSSYLSRLFKQKNGVGIAEYITECRIRIAKDLLADQRHRIQDIAPSSGFTSVQYFYRVFKKSTGMTPQEWRDRSSRR